MHAWKRCEDVAHHIEHVWITMRVALRSTVSCSRLQQLQTAFYTNSSTMAARGPWPAALTLAP